MENKLGTPWILGVIAGLAIGGVAGYWYGGKTGYDLGYATAEADAQKAEEEAAKQAMEEAAKVANPFLIENPLKEVETNPFNQVKKVLNPFE